MTNKTVFSKEEVQRIKKQWLDNNRAAGVADLIQMAGQAVLQSPEIQQLLKDAERLDSGRIMTHERDDFGGEYMCERRGIDLRASIDAAMEVKP